MAAGTGSVRERVTRNNGLDLPLGKLFTMVPNVNSSDSRRFVRAYGQLWMALHRGDDPDLSQHERELLHHVPATGGVPLQQLAWHLSLPKSTASTLVKDLERRGFLTRVRDSRDERRLAITLTDTGSQRVAQDSVLDLERLTSALDRLSAGERAALIEAMERLATLASRRAPNVRPRKEDQSVPPA